MQTYVPSMNRVAAHAVFEESLLPSGAPDDLLMRIGPDGRVQAFYHLGLGVDINDLLVTDDDHLWVASPTKGLLHYQLPAAPAPAGP